MNGEALTREAMIKNLVDKFLAWPLPDSVCSDLCATKQGYPHRSGTTLLTATEAKQMIEHLLDGTPIAALQAKLAEYNVSIEGLQQQRNDKAHLLHNAESSIVRLHSQLTAAERKYEAVKNDPDYAQCCEERKKAESQRDALAREQAGSIELDHYEANNLLEAVRAVLQSDGDEPLSVLNSGDWIGQIAYKVEKWKERNPGPGILSGLNNAVEEYKAEALHRAGLRLACEQAGLREAVRKLRMRYEDSQNNRRDVLTQLDVLDDLEVMINSVKAQQALAPEPPRGTEEGNHG